MSDIIRMIKTTDGYKIVDTSTMPVAPTQIEFLAKCIGMAAKEGFYNIKQETVYMSMLEFGFTEEEIGEVCSSYFLDDAMVECKLINFFIKE